MFAKRLKELRFKLELTQDVLAKTLGVSQQTIANWETGKVTPNILVLKEIVQRFNVSADYLLGCDDVEGVAQLSEEQVTVLSIMEELSVANKQKVLGYMEGLLHEQRYSRQVKFSTLKTFSTRPKIKVRG